MKKEKPKPPEVKETKEFNLLEKIELEYQAVKQRFLKSIKDEEGKSKKD